MLIVKVKIAKEELNKNIRVGILLSLLVLVIFCPVELGSEISLPSFDIGGVCMPPVIEPWQLVVLTILQEASSEGLVGMTVVAEVIRDRAENKFNSDGTIPGTVLAPQQFSGWNTNDPNRIRVAKYDISHPSVADAIRAYNNAFIHRTSYAKGANLYHADWMDPYPEWTKSPDVKRIGQVGHHILYKETRT